MSNLNADTLIDLLFIHFNVTTMADLAMHISVSQQTISKWKQRNSVNAIKKKCIELGIYNEIFGDLKLSLSENSKEENKKEIIELLAQSLKKDRTKSQILGFTKLNLLEMTRKHMCSND